MGGQQTSTCVTRGVEVTGRCLYMPEHHQGWTYSIAFRLVGNAEERGFETCQLAVRKWVITTGDGPPQVVRGEGVIGLFPILTDGGWMLNRESDPHGVPGCGTWLAAGFVPVSELHGPWQWQEHAGEFRRRGHLHPRQQEVSHRRSVPGHCRTVSTAGTRVLLLT